MVLCLLELTDSGHVARGEVVLGETEQNATLAYRRVSNDYKLNQVIVLFLTPSTVHDFSFKNFLILKKL